MSDNINSSKLKKHSKRASSKTLVLSKKGGNYKKKTKDDNFLISGNLRGSDNMFSNTVVGNNENIKIFQLGGNCSNTVVDGNTCVGNIYFVGNKICSNIGSDGNIIGNICGNIVCGDIFRSNIVVGYGNILGNLVQGNINVSYGNICSIDANKVDFSFSKHQTDAIHRIVTDLNGAAPKHGIVLVHEMGSGKTITVLSTIANCPYFDENNNEIKRIIFTPKGLDQPWISDMKKITISGETESLYRLIETHNLVDRTIKIEIPTTTKFSKEFRLKWAEKYTTRNQEKTNKIGSTTSKYSHENRFTVRRNGEKQQKYELEWYKLNMGQKIPKPQKKSAEKDTPVFNNEFKCGKEACYPREYPYFYYYNHLVENDDDNMFDRFKNSIIVFDEAHNLTKIIKMLYASEFPEVRNRAFRLLHALNSARYLILLTGTPVESNVSELKYLVNIAAGKEIIPLTEFDFILKYTKFNFDDFKRARDRFDSSNIGAILFYTKKTGSVVKLLLQIFGSGIKDMAFTIYQYLINTKRNLRQFKEQNHYEYYSPMLYFTFLSKWRRFFLVLIGAAISALSVHWGLAKFGMANPPKWHRIPIEFIDKLKQNAYLLGNFIMSGVGIVGKGVKQFVLPLFSMKQALVMSLISAACGQILSKAPSLRFSLNLHNLLFNCLRGIRHLDTVRKQVSCLYQYIFVPQIMEYINKFVSGVFNFLGIAGWQYLIINGLGYIAVLMWPFIIYNKDINTILNSQNEFSDDNKFMKDIQPYLSYYNYVRLNNKRNLEKQSFSDLSKFPSICISSTIECTSSSSTLNDNNEKHKLIDGSGINGNGAVQSKHWLSTFQLYISTLTICKNLTNKNLNQIIGVSSHINDFILEDYTSLLSNEMTDVQLNKFGQKICNLDSDSLYFGVNRSILELSYIEDTFTDYFGIIRRIFGEEKDLGIYLPSEAVTYRNYSKLDIIKCSIMHSVMIGLNEIFISDQITKAVSVSRRSSAAAASAFNAAVDAVKAEFEAEVDEAADEDDDEDDDDGEAAAAAADEAADEDDDEDDDDGEAAEVDDNDKQTIFLTIKEILDTYPSETIFLKKIKNNEFYEDIYSKLVNISKGGRGDLYYTPKMILKCKVLFQTSKTKYENEISKNSILVKLDSWFKIINKAFTVLDTDKKNELYKKSNDILFYTKPGEGSVETGGCQNHTIIKRDLRTIHAGSIKTFINYHFDYHSEMNYNKIKTYYPLPKVTYIESLKKIISDFWLPGINDEDESYQLKSAANRFTGKQQTYKDDIIANAMKKLDKNNEYIGQDISMNFVFVPLKDKELLEYKKECYGIIDKFCKEIKQSINYNYLYEPHKLILKNQYAKLAMFLIHFELNSKNTDKSLFELLTDKSSFKQNLIDRNLSLKESIDWIWINIDKGRTISILNSSGIVLKETSDDRPVSFKNDDLQDGFKKYLEEQHESFFNLPANIGFYREELTGLSTEQGYGSFSKKINAWKDEFLHEFMDLKKDKTLMVRLHQHFAVKTICRIFIGRIFECEKFKKCVEGDIDANIKYTDSLIKDTLNCNYLPVVYSNYYNQGYKEFAAYLTNREIPYIPIDVNDDLDTRTYLQELSSVVSYPLIKKPTQKIYPTKGLNIEEEEVNYPMNAPKYMKYFHDVVDNFVNSFELDTIPEVIVENVFPYIKSIKDLTCEKVRIKSDPETMELVKKIDLSDKNESNVEELFYNSKYILKSSQYLAKKRPVCALLHPDLIEGISFPMSPNMHVLEVPDGFGKRDQIYARILRFIADSEPTILRKKENDFIKDIVCKQEKNKEIRWENIDDNCEAHSSVLTAFKKNGMKEAIDGLNQIYKCKLDDGQPEQSSTKIYNNAVEKGIIMLAKDKICKNAVYLCDNQKRFLVNYGLGNILPVKSNQLIHNALTEMGADKLLANCSDIQALDSYILTQKQQAVRAAQLTLEQESKAVTKAAVDAEAAKVTASSRASDAASAYETDDHFAGIAGLKADSAQAASQKALVTLASTQVALAQAEATFASAQAALAEAERILTQLNAYQELTDFRKAEVVNFYFQNFVTSEINYNFLEKNSRKIVEMMLKTSIFNNSVDLTDEFIKIYQSNLGVSYLGETINTKMDEFITRIKNIDTNDNDIINSILKYNFNDLESSKPDSNIKYFGFILNYNQEFHTNVSSRDLIIENSSIKANLLDSDGSITINIDKNKSITTQFFLDPTNARNFIKGDKQKYVLFKRLPSDIKNTYLTLLEKNDKLQFIWQMKKQIIQYSRLTRGYTIDCLVPSDFIKEQLAFIIDKESWEKLRINQPFSDKRIIGEKFSLWRQSNDNPAQEIFGYNSLITFLVDTKAHNEMIISNMVRSLYYTNARNRHIFNKETSQIKEIDFAKFSQIKNQYESFDEYLLKTNKTNSDTYKKVQKFLEEIDDNEIDDNRVNIELCTKLNFQTPMSDNLSWIPKGKACVLKRMINQTGGGTKINTLNYTKSKDNRIRKWKKWYNQSRLQEDMIKEDISDEVVFQLMINSTLSNLVKSVYDSILNFDVSDTNTDISKKLEECLADDYGKKLSDYIVVNNFLYKIIGSNSLIGLDITFTSEEFEIICSEAINEIRMKTLPERNTFYKLHKKYFPVLASRTIEKLELRNCKLPDIAYYRDCIQDVTTKKFYKKYISNNELPVFINVNEGTVWGIKLDKYFNDNHDKIYGKHITHEMTFEMKQEYNIEKKKFFLNRIPVWKDISDKNKIDYNTIVHPTELYQEFINQLKVSQKLILADKLKYQQTFIDEQKNLGNFDYNLTHHPDMYSEAVKEYIDKIFDLNLSNYDFAKIGDLNQDTPKSNFKDGIALELVNEDLITDKPIGYFDGTSIKFSDEYLKKLILEDIYLETMKIIVEKNELVDLSNTQEGQQTLEQMCKTIIEPYEMLSFTQLITIPNELKQNKDDFWITYATREELAAFEDKGLCDPTNRKKWIEILKIKYDNYKPNVSESTQTSSIPKAPNLAHPESILKPKDSSKAATISGIDQAKSMGIYPSSKILPSLEKTSPGISTAKSPGIFPLLSIDNGIYPPYAFPRPNPNSNNLDEVN
jgi:hypothetical protein